MDNSEYDTFQWTCTTGVNPGYDLDAQENIAIERITEMYQMIAGQVYEETGVYISAVIWPSRTMYSSEWGCPAGGELSYTFSGSCNPEFSTGEEYKRALLILIDRIKDALQQSTILLEIVPAHIVYRK